MPYEPRNPHHLRYVSDFNPSSERLQLMEQIVLRINHYLGYDFNTVELAIRDGIPYAIDFCNPAPDAEKASVGEENFDWVVETAANYAIERALAHKDGMDNLTWGEYIKRSSAKQQLTNERILQDFIFHKKSEQKNIKYQAIFVYSTGNKFIFTK